MRYFENMKKIIIIGSGGREHALAWKLYHDPKVEKIYCIPGNGGTKDFATNLDINFKDFNKILEVTEKYKIDMIIVGPENPLCNGIVDFFNNKKVKIFGPTKFASKLESSKLFARKFMKDNNIPQPIFYESDSFEKSVRIRNEIGIPLVLKADGLAAGKGVIMCYKESEFINGLKVLFEDKKFGAASHKISIEECLIGDELSVFAVVDGKNYVVIGDAQDHKRVFDNDRGPNTGGMGSYSPTKICTPSLLKKVKKQIIEPTINGMNNLNEPFKGFLYVGLMIVNGNPYVIEFNVRMGDPETQVVIPRIDSSFYDLLEKAIDGDLADFNIQFKDSFYTTVVLASKGYPDKYEKGQKIKISDDRRLLFHAGTKSVNDKIFVDGGRVMNVVGNGKTLEESIKDAYRQIEGIKFNNIFFRKDIGKKGI